MINSEDGTKILKPEADWSKDKDDEALINKKMLNAIFNSVDKNMFRLINTCTEAKEAWEILKTAHEGTSKVRMSRQQLITTKFGNMRMMEGESISELNISLLDIVNNSFALEENMLEQKLVIKILRSLPKKFDIKVTAIEEAQYLSTIKI